MAISSVVLRPSPVSSPAAAAAASSPRRHASVLRVTSSKRRPLFSRAATSLTVRCEQTAKPGGGGGADVWLSRLAMVSFSTAVVVEVSTGKGLVANLGVATPAPTLALVVTSLAAGLAVYFIFQAGSRN
uniref:Stress enhanced protein 1 n=1 Tax=Oryza punctata TaxID=4537 RepID=A0A0E0MHB8_ORYPU